MGHKPHCERKGQGKSFQSGGTRSLGRGRGRLGGAVGPSSRVWAGSGPYFHKAFRPLSRVTIMSILALEHAALGWHHGAWLQGQGPWAGTSERPSQWETQAVERHFRLGKVDRRSHGDHDDSSGPDLSLCSQDHLNPGRYSVCAWVCVPVRSSEWGRTPITTDIRFFHNPNKKGSKLNLIWMIKKTSNVFLSPSFIEQFTPATHLLTF